MGEKPQFDLSELTEFRFAPDWAKEGAPTTPITYRESRDPRRDGERRGGRPGSPGRRPGRDGAAPSGSRRERTERGARPDRGDRRPRREDRRPVRQQVEPAEGLRVELRPTNSSLQVFAKEVQEHKRVYPLLSVAGFIMAGKDRYDLVFMRLENGPMLIHSKKGDGACWLTEEEALAYLPKAPWFSEFYTTEQQQAEPPKGSFSAIAKCSRGGELIGPNNWHGYQAALMQLYRAKYAHMPLDAFKNSIVTEKGEEVVSQWLQQVSTKSVWRPTREDAAETVLESLKDVQADFRAHHYEDAYEVVDKVFVNGATPAEVLSPGLEAHLYTLATRTRKHPQILIPNLCHGMARNHVPIFKWQGNHYTGPGRVRAIPADTTLADRMAAIVAWAKEHSGERVDAMFAALSGTAAGTEEATAAFAPYAADLIWLLDQGFLVVMNDNTLWFPKGEVAPPAPTRDRERTHRKRSKKTPSKPKQAAPSADTPADTTEPQSPVHESE